MKNKFNEQVERVADLIKREGRHGVLLFKNPDTNIPDYLLPLIEDIEIKESNFVTKGELYFMDKEMRFFGKPTKDFVLVDQPK